MLQDHVGHSLRLVPVRGYSPVWGSGEGLELWCEDCHCLLDEFGIEREDDEDEDEDDSGVP